MAGFQVLTCLEGRRFSPAAMVLSVGGTEAGKEQEPSFGKPRPLGNNGFQAVLPQHLCQILKKLTFIQDPKTVSKHLIHLPFDSCHSME